MVDNECGPGGCREGGTPVMLKAKAVRLLAPNRGTGIIPIEMKKTKIAKKTDGRTGRETALFCLRVPSQKK